MCSIIEDSTQEEVEGNRGWLWGRSWKKRGRRLQIWENKVGKEGWERKYKQNAACEELFFSDDDFDCKAQIQG